MKISRILLVGLGFLTNSEAFVLPGPSRLFGVSTRLKVSPEVQELPKSEILRSYELNARQLVQFKDKLENENAGKLLEKIENDKIQEIIFSQELNVVVSLDDENKVHKTDIHPLLSTELVQVAKNHHTEIMFLPVQNDFGFLKNLLYIPLIYIGLNLIRGLFTFNRILPFGGNSGPGGGMNDLSFTQTPNVSLSEWAGSPEIFEECTEIVSYLRDNTNYEKVGAKIPSGILLEGPPGTGKTLLAKAIATEAEANFIAVTGSEFVELFVGMGASRVRKLFQEARKRKPAIIFIDEIDALGKQRNSASGFGGNDEREQTLNQLLSEMDGFRGNENILVIGATNRKDILDAALLRPGRFDRIITVPLPDGPSRKAILGVHMKKFQMAPAIDLEPIISLTSGFSGAQLKNLLNEAAILVAREGGDVITNRHIFEALEKLLVGVIRKMDNRDAATLERVAVHEIGHTLAVLAFPEIYDFEKVTIQSTYKGAGGYTIFREKESLTEGGMYTRDIFFKRLMVALGGKAAESVIYGRDNVSLGAFQDLKEANGLARRMINDFGMGTKLEVFAKAQDNGGFVPTESQYIMTQVDREALELVNAAYKSVVELLENNKEQLLEIKDKLLASKTRYLDKNSLGPMDLQR